MGHRLGQNTKYLIFKILKYLYVEDNQLSLSQTISKQSKRHWTKYLISRHFCECGVQLLGDGLELVLLSQQLILQSVNLLLQLNDGFFSKLSSCFGLFQFSGQSLDLIFVECLPLVGFVLGHLQGLEVVGHDLQLLLQLDDLELPGGCSLLAHLQVPLALSHLLLGVVILPVRVLGHLLRLLQLSPPPPPSSSRGFRLRSPSPPSRPS